MKPGASTQMWRGTTASVESRKYQVEVAKETGVQTLGSHCQSCFGSRETLRTTGLEYGGWDVIVPGSTVR